MEKVRIAILNSHPIQYFAPLYAFLNKDEGLDITALYCSDFSLRGGLDPGFNQSVSWDVDLLSGYRSIFLGDYQAGKRTPKGFWSLIVPELWHEVRSGKYDAVVLHGYNYAAYVIAFLAAKSKGIPVMMRSETHLGLSRKKWKQRLRDGVLSVIYRHVDSFLSIGSANRTYYRSLGIPENRIFDVPYTVDNERFIKAARLSPEERISVRKSLGLPGAGPVILFASKFMRRKHPDDVLRAAESLRNMGLQFTILMIGAGEMEAELKKMAASLKLDNIIFGGFVNQAELPRVYAACDVFVLPSENEPWGLIVNEVMCAGLPVVVADKVGCAPDLVKDGVNGFLIQAGNVPSLVRALHRLIVDDDLRGRMGRESLRLIMNWSYEQCRLGVRSAVASLRHERMGS
jgi:glycosyltransferase involved in cell wall biosynthesis